VFPDLTSPVALRFLQASPTPEAASALTKQAFGQFVRTRRYRQSESVLSAAYARLGDFLAPALLAKFGDDRHQFPSPASLQALAGTCPVTEQSGKGRRIFFRQACDHEFRQIVQQWAKASMAQSSWATTYWHSVRERAHSTSHAYRCLANRWLAIAWECWQSHQPYDEAVHLQNRARRLARR
jgi:transposase